MSTQPVNPPLASPGDVQAALGRPLTSQENARVTGILVKASELFRAEAKQLFTPGRSEVRLKSNGGEVVLPERPAGEIHSAVDDDNRALTYTRRKQTLVTRLASHEFLTVDYDHGSLTVPDLVRTTIAEVAMKILSISDEAAAGVVQANETTGPFSESRTYAAWAQGGQTMLAPSDIKVARSFRPKRPSLIVMRSI